MIEIFADMRESRSGVIKALSEMENLSVKIGSLPCGDYALGPR